MASTHPQKDYVTHLIELSCSIVLDKGQNLQESGDYFKCVTLQVEYIRTGVERYQKTGVINSDMIACVYNLFSNFYNQNEDDSRTFLYGNIKDELGRIALNG